MEEVEEEEEEEERVKGKNRGKMVEVYFTHFLLRCKEMPAPLFTFGEHTFLCYRS